jgi:hypothetical protein
VRLVIECPALTLVANEAQAAQRIQFPRHVGAFNTSADLVEVLLMRPNEEVLKQLKSLGFLTKRTQSSGALHFQMHATTDQVE